MLIKGKREKKTRPEKGNERTSARFKKKTKTYKHPGAREKEAGLDFGCSIHKTRDWEGTSTKSARKKCAHDKKPFAGRGMLEPLEMNLMKKKNAQKHLA